MLSASVAEKKRLRNDVAVAIGVAYARLVLWDRSDVSRVTQTRQVEVNKNWDKYGYEFWNWCIAGKNTIVAALVVHWDGTRADSSLFNPINFICSCDENNIDMCLHKVATMIVASSSPVTVAEAMGYRVNITGYPVKGLLAGEK